MVLARTRRRSIPIAVLLTVVATLLVPAAPAHAARAATFAATVAAIEALPYQPVYVPLGFDAAFPDALVLNVPPANDYSAGSIPGSPTAPAWPSVFKPVTITSTDGAKLLGMVAVHPGPHPGVVVAHGFNTNGKLSSIRWRTVNQTPLGAPLSSQLVPIATPSRAAADAALAPFVCDTSKPPPGRPLP